MYCEERSPSCPTPSQLITSQRPHLIPSHEFRASPYERGQGTQFSPLHLWNGLVTSCVKSEAPHVSGCPHCNHCHSAGSVLVCQASPKHSVCAKLRPRGWGPRAGSECTAPTWTLCRSQEWAVWERLEHCVVSSPQQKGVRAVWGPLW